MKKIIAFLLLFSPIACFAASNVLINEIAWMGTAASANSEWLELFNPTASEIDLTGWRLESSDGSPKITLSGKIPAGGYFLLERTGDDTVPGIAADQIYTGSLSNTGEWLQLFDAAGNIVDEANAAVSWPGGDNTTKQTMERISLTAWQTSQDPGGTPKAASSLVQPPDNPPADDGTGTPPTDDDAGQASTAAGGGSAGGQDSAPEIKKGEIVINEILPDPAGPDTAGEFVELKNISQKIIDLSGCRITNSAGQEFMISGLTLAPKGLVVFWRENTKLILNNDKDKVTLYSKNKKIIDSKSYQPALEGRSYQRTDNNQWCWAKAAAGQDTACEPEVFPLAKISGPAQAAAGQILIFDASDSFDPKDRPLKYLWDFGDGQTALGTTTYQIYRQPGSYKIILTAAATDSASSTDTIKIKITGDSAPLENAIASTTPTTTPVFDSPINYTEPPKIFIAEFLPDPDAEKSQAEFIELSSAENFPVDISGWQLTDSGRGHFIVPPGTIIKPDMPLAFFKTQTKIALNNDGDTITLAAPDGETIDFVKYDSSTKGVSYVLDEDLNWQPSETPTPDEINALNPAPAPAANNSSTPKILGAATAGKTNESVPTATPSTSKIKYFISAIFAAAAVGIGAIFKFKKG